MEIKGMRVVDDNPKSKAEIEEQLLQEHAEENNLVEEQPVEPVVEPVVEETAPAVKAEISDEDVLSYIREKKNLEINSLDEFDEMLSRKPEVNFDEEVMTYNKYKQETGRSLEDFLKLQKDWSAEDPEAVLKQFYKDQDPDLTNRELDYKLKQFRYDEDLDDDDEIAEKRLKMREELKKAVGHYESQKEQYKLPVASTDNFVPESEREDYMSYKQYKEQATSVEEENHKRLNYFAEQTNKLFTNEFEGFKFEVGDKTVSWKPAEGNALKDSQMRGMEFFGQFLDDSGYVKDVEGFHKAMAVAMNANKLAAFAYEQGKADGINQLEKEAKNIEMVHQPPKVAKDGIKMRVLDDGQPSFKIKKK